jgi:hypothetical protein
MSRPSDWSPVGLDADPTPGGSGAGALGWAGVSGGCPLDRQRGGADFVRYEANDHFLHVEFNSNSRIGTLSALLTAP